MDNNTKKIVFDVSYAAFLKIILIGLGLVVLYLIRDLLLIIVVAVVIASAIDSWVDWLQKRRVPRWLSVILIFTGLIGAIAVVFSLLIPPIVEQTQQLVGVLPSYFDIMMEKFRSLEGLLGEGTYTSVKDVVANFGNTLSNSTGGIFQTITGVFGGIFSAVIVVVLAFYFTVEENSLKKFIKSLVPLKHRPYADDLAARIQVQIGRWLRGQILLGFVVGILYYIGLSLMGVKYALVIAILGGLLEIIPYLGPILAAIPAVFLAFAQSPFLALLVVVLYIVVQQLENHLLVPKIMQKVVGLNPLITIIVILVGAKLAGIVGGVMAVPIATAISVFMSDIFESKDEKDKEKLKEEICKAEDDMSGLSKKDREMRQKLKDEVCADPKVEKEKA